MANTKQVKKYLGSWDTSAYDDVSKASQQAYQTNWDILRNRYNNLVAEENRKDEIAREAYSKALSSQLTTDLQTQDAVNRALADRGVSNSGLRQNYLNQQISNTGNTVNKALTQLLNTSLNSAGSLYGGLSNLLSGGTQLDSQQNSDQLDILSKRVAEDLEGQQLAASIAESQAQRALRNSLSGVKKNKEEEDLEEAERRYSILAILNNIDPSTGDTLNLSDSMKSYMLRNFYNVNDSEGVVNLYNNSTPYNSGFYDTIFRKIGDETPNNFTPIISVGRNEPPIENIYSTETPIKSTYSTIQDKYNIIADKLRNQQNWR